MDLMIDLETLGTKSNCPVISIGVVPFDVEKLVVLKAPEALFYRCLDVQNQLDMGRKVDAATIKWWMGQSGAAKHVFKETAKDPKEVLISFVAHIMKYPKATVWGNGDLFDIGILESLLLVYGLEIPWSHTKINDLRTFKRFVGKGAQVIKRGTDHNALDDADSQATYVIEHLVKQKLKEQKTAQILQIMMTALSQIDSDVARNAVKEVEELLKETK